jgi:hypothetical protein
MPNKTGSNTNGRRSVQFPGLELDLAAVIRPVQHGLALPWTAGQIARFTMLANLADMAAHCLPTLDLARVFVRNSTTHEVTTMPLKPTTRIIGMNPPLLRHVDSGRLASTRKKFREQSRPPGAVLRQ